MYLYCEKNTFIILILFSLCFSPGVFKKLFWVVLTLVLAALWLYQTFLILTTYLTFGVTVSIDISTQRHLVFPAVTICNQNLARESKIQADETALNITGGASEGRKSEGKESL